ncbi:S46 family peptidase [Cesiribacter andamanensis]|uniref:Dipeptidyl-peptidase n=1 Tax=Cesiribacter andamanensis AMV16 TaxID=1279009 RepID=M7N6L4_9BACT|nr:S46 family peptidase [Cesiribacter andamanensis]EMR04248.1 Peptidase S46 [Cesiribacter andamanensis AMV16]
MKRIFTLLLALCLSPALWAAEGMWLPLMLKALQDDMQAHGMKLTAEEIYSVNQSSLKDAIVSFGGFCTGELISDQGLILTNHHCGYGAIQSHSSVQDDLLTNGFWARTKEEEKPNPSLFVTFIVRMEDVTEQVLQGLDPKLSETEREKQVSERIRQISQQATQGTHYKALIKPFFYGNEYYMFVTETYDDVRLVGTPPSSIGKFGGDTDNWMWPRHTGDFSLFRVYAGPDGKPAKYSPNNKPLKPKHHLPVSLEGVQEGDFTMVFGFPGRTQQYLTSHAVKILMEQTNPHRIDIRDKRLEILDRHMKANDTVRIQYASKYASVANYWKKWIGENRGLKQLNTLEEKRAQEQAFQQWAAQDPQRNEQYGKLLARFAELYQQQERVDLANNYHREALLGVELIKLAGTFNALASGSLPAAELSAGNNRFTTALERHFKDYNAAADKDVFVHMLLLYKQQVPQQFQPEPIRKLPTTEAGIRTYADKLYSQSVLASRQKMQEQLSTYDPKKTAARLRKDPGFVLYGAIQEVFEKQIAPVYAATDPELELLYRRYVAGLRQMQQDKLFYPDANSTLRVAYGKVGGYTPQDGVQYLPYTTLEGIMEKEDPSNEEFIVPERLKEIYRTKDYGPYATEDYMPVCFVASNHTTGGNSGSPVIDAKGRLIGLNFDRSWESTMSDVKYSPEICRNIAVDIRYVLLIIDKFAGATHLVEEMTLVDANTTVEIGGEVMGVH